MIGWLLDRIAASLIAGMDRIDVSDEALAGWFVGHPLVKPQPEET